MVGSSRPPGTQTAVFPVHLHVTFRPGISLCLRFTSPEDTGPTALGPTGAHLHEFHLQ